MGLRRVVYGAFGRAPRWAKSLVTRFANRRFLVGIIAIVENEAGEVLILEHTYRPGFEYGLPSGWLKPADTLASGIEREILEETGYVVRFRGVLRAEAKPSPRRVDIWLLCDLIGGAFRQSAEVRGALFVSSANLPKLLPVQRAFLEEYWRGREDVGASSP